MSEITIEQQAPKIIPPEYFITLSEEYTETFIGPFTILYADNVSLESYHPELIVWDSEANGITIAEGLPAGSYNIQIIATNAYGSDTYDYFLDIMGVDRISYYIMTDANNIVINFHSTGVSPLPDGDWQLLTESGLGAQFRATPTAEENVITTEDGFYMYTFIDGQINERSSTDIQTDRDAQKAAEEASAKLPTDHQRLDNLESAFNEVAKELIDQSIIQPLPETASFSTRLNALENAFVELTQEVYK